MDQTPPKPESTGPLVTEEGQVNLEALSQRLGPFEPPADFDHGHEFDPAPPRPIMRRLRTGSFGRRRWSTVLTLFVLGLGCVFFAPFEFVEQLSSHILPLKYLKWIGWGLIGLAVIIGVANRLSKDRYRYVVEGEPLIGRVLGIFTPVRVVLDPQTKAVTEFFRYLAAVEFLDPRTNKLERTAVLSEDEWDVKQQLKFDAGVDAGEYVTLVRLPGQGLESVKLYGFLGLDPDRDFITKDERPLTGVSPITAVLISVIVLLCLWFLMLGIYVIQLCIPREWSWSAALPFLAAGAVLGAIGLAWVIWLDQRKQNTPRKSGVVFAALGGAFLGTLAGAVSMGAVNAAFDKSAPSYQPIRIQNHWQTTHNFVFRTYEVEYTPLAGGQPVKHGASVDDLIRLGPAKLGALEIRQGALGLEWIAAVHPVDWRRLEGEPTADELPNAVEVVLPVANAAPGVRMLPVLIVENDEQGERTVPCPSEFVDAAVEDLKGRLGIPGVKIERLQKK